DVRAQILDGLLRSITDEVRDNLAGAYRGNPDGRLQQAIGDTFATMLASTNTYLNSLGVGALDGGAALGNGSEPDRGYATVVHNTIAAWAAAESELDRLLQKRIAGLVEGMRWTLALTGALAALSIAIAFMTHRHIVRPLERLESVASTVRETK